MPLEDDKRDWFLGLINKGHTPKFNEDGAFDIFVEDYGFHNGPGCSVCNWSCCMWCTPLDKIPICKK